MMTPIVDFVQKYVNSNMTRFHMPGHKGHVFFGCEPYDITEIEGADVLHHGDGIIQDSQNNASKLFGSGATHYSTEGSTLCIKAMLAILKMQQGMGQGQNRPFILAARNVHRSMIDACALLDLDVRFIPVRRQTSLCSCVVEKEDLSRALQQCQDKPLGVYITSPDYLGQMADIKALSEVCRGWGLPLLVDNAHGAYLHFLEQPVHPMDLGAAMCSDSAHKTLPGLTGTAYLHIHRDYLEQFEPYAAQALMLFGSTSPSYLLMQSLDLCNTYLEQGYQDSLKELVIKIAAVKKRFQEQGICVEKSEPLKIVLHTAANGYRGEEIAQELRNFEIECEYADGQSVVLMMTPENTEQDWERLCCWSEHTKLLMEKRPPLPLKPLPVLDTERVFTIREAVFGRSEILPVEKAIGRVCATETVSCPPAIPIAVSGERITKEMAELFLQYGIKEISVLLDEKLL